MKDGTGLSLKIYLKEYICSPSSRLKKGMKKNGRKERQKDNVMVIFSSIRFDKYFNKEDEKRNILFGKSKTKK
jgi:hypothetical protein